MMLTKNLLRILPLLFGTLLFGTQLFKTQLFRAQLLFGPQLFAKTVEEAIPITSKNLKGHQVLYNEGWLAVSSSKKALDYAYEHGVKSSREAWDDMESNLKSGTQDFKKDIVSEGSQSTKAAQEYKTSMKKRVKATEVSFKKSAKEMSQSAKEMRLKAFDTFVLGYIQLNKRTEEDISELKKANGNIFGPLKNDYSNFTEVFENLNESTRKEEQGVWERSFLLANEEFQKEFAESREQKNSIMGLINLGAGYLKAFYYGVFRPTGATAVAVVGTGYKLLERTVVSVGKTFFYSSKVGYKVISPTLEGGLLSSISIVTWTSSKVVQGVGTGLNVFNQAAIVSSTPVYQSGQWLLATTADTAKYLALSTYEIGKGVGSIVVNETKAGLVLGYNALTAIPIQALMGVANSVIFLGYEGPKLAIYAAKGEINGISTSDLPVGAVVDMEKLKSQNIEVKKISEDPSVIEGVLQKSSEDLRQ